jgi:endonuclease/exonuclease/phosphatase family metal-dependent hydrolase
MTQAMVTKYALPIILVALILTACHPITNYDESGPLFSGEYASESPPFDGVLKVVSWNIKFSEKIPEALEDLTAFAELQNADIILLQEMDEEGVDTLARTLSYNYVYFPASVHTYHDRDFGNAILARWPISDAEKLILPYKNPKNQQSRIATKASVWIEGVEVSTYSVHTETFWLPPNQRLEQVQTIIDDIDPDADYAIVGGDFNTLTPMSVDAVVNRFDLSGFEWATDGANDTITSDLLPLVTDFIFTKNMIVLESGSVDDINASDHKPVWASIRFE